MTNRNERLIERDDEDPVAWIRRVRDENQKRFKTVGALFDHLKTVPSAAECLAALDAEIAARKAKVAPPRSRPASNRRRRTAKA